MFHGKRYQKPLGKNIKRGVAVELGPAEYFRRLEKARKFLDAQELKRFPRAAVKRTAHAAVAAGAR